MRPSEADSRRDEGGYDDAGIDGIEAGAKRRRSERTAPLAGHTGIDDPRALQILSTEHWSLLDRAVPRLQRVVQPGRDVPDRSLSATLIVIGFLIGTQGLLDGAAVPAVAILLLASTCTSARRP